MADTTAPLRSEHHHTHDNCRESDQHPGFDRTSTTRRIIMNKKALVTVASTTAAIAAIGLISAGTAGEVAPRE
ncbi:hypothetical protein GFS60_06301 (plasmid) [Rhodococcus sp. WAY2]|nr:hypothetical protein GFS60_06301 [Rhodococcus sp. WAY2]